VKYSFVYKSKGHGKWTDRMSGGTIRMHGDIVANAKTVKRTEDRHSSHHDDGRHSDRHDDD
jgi:hypothetical protein